MIPHAKKPRKRLRFRGFFMYLRFQGYSSTVTNALSRAEAAFCTAS
ncbi:hypothetical protein SAMN05877838_1135 [Hoeflea halophila]|uniref:Uncharacterized protein n=1 Tax=Hoeflea halophila TaxID=714899 RepID=A0A286IAC4_9HYPH|nr:hypothetical protein SAMN05877838_1135 [Hoeflea halophila]